MKYSFSILANCRTYAIELRERNYPTFEGRYNAYVSVYGQLSGQYLGAIPYSIASDITENEVPEILLNADKFVMQSNCRAEIW